MPNFPFFRFNYPYLYSQFSNYNKANYTLSSNAHTDTNNFKNKKNQNESFAEPILEIMGIKLFQDDILILGLLFFLYKEGVKDEMLFLSLIFLLLP